MKRIVYREWRIAPERYWGLLAILAVIIGIGGAAALYMEHQGHWVTGMTNSVVWGTPHVFAVFLIVAASGALNVASIGSVFGKVAYKPLGRLSGLLAAALLVGGLLVLVLDLGRPDRLVVAMTHYNFSSIFAWNIFLYTGFLAVVIAYLWTMAERKGNHLTQPVGTFAFVWRLALTTATGSIFGFLVGRQAYDTAVLAPMFVVMSFAYGLAVYMLVLMFSFDWDERPIGPRILKRLKNLLGIFIAAVLYFTLVYHLTKLYGAKNTDIETFLLINGGIYTALFWVGWVLVGGLVPLGIIYHPGAEQGSQLDRRRLRAGRRRRAIGPVRHHRRQSGLSAGDLPWQDGAGVWCPRRRRWSGRPLRAELPGNTARNRWRWRGDVDYGRRRAGAAVPARVTGGSGRRSARDGTLGLSLRGPLAVLCNNRLANL